MPLKLIVGNKNYSSWSLRPWIAMKAAGIPFEEQVISLDAPDFKARGRRGLRPRQGAGAGRRRRVGVGIAGDHRISGGEISRRRPVAGRRPRRGRMARAVANEMHAGFQPLRKLMPMNQARPVIKRALTPEAAANVRRIEALWPDCRARYGSTAGRFCSANSAPPTPCTRRWWRASTPTPSRCRRRRAPTWTR